ncbi:MlaE family ABC transporter permease [Streptomyces iconiensis]|uniref:ABC transporter permease n=1 Tax=Streptomyces iconiensis TaxID=1384038 RepID=A0ABT7A8D6_9ACTN|nr:ABC transporter permease [Streptomyces iconiensis]MDJ1137560.1 ABC transporter permease [Streptomyces iconiensis]
MTTTEPEPPASGGDPSGGNPADGHAAEGTPVGGHAADGIPREGKGAEDGNPPGGTPGSGTPTSGTPPHGLPTPPSPHAGNGAAAPVAKLPARGLGFLREPGKLFALALAVLRAIFRRPFQVREFIEQFWFIASVTILPAALVSIPFGAVVALQVGSLASQISAQSFTGAASVLVNIQQASPLIVALLISGAAGSAICADLGSRKIREELDAMEVMGVSPIQRLVVPRVLATVCVAVLLNGMVSVVGTLGGYFFNVVLQDGTPGAYLASFSALAQLPDLYISEIKALIFGFIAGIVASYRGLNPRGGPKGVGDAVNQSVVITFLLLFFVNMVLTAIYLQLVPPKGA